MPIQLRRTGGQVKPVTRRPICVRHHRFGRSRASTMIIEMPQKEHLAHGVGLNEILGKPIVNRQESDGEDHQGDASRRTRCPPQAQRPDPPIMRSTNAQPASPVGRARFPVSTACALAAVPSMARLAIPCRIAASRNML